MKLRYKRLLKKFKNRKGEIDWLLLDYIMHECGFERNFYRFSYDWKKDRNTRLGEE